MRIYNSLLLLGGLIIGSIFFSPSARLSVVSPKPGDILQGVVPVTGSTNVTGFISYEVSFSFEKDDNATWFLIQQSNETVSNGNLAVWDTTTITDGDYRLRIQVALESGQKEELIIGGLRIRNYTPVETLADVEPETEVADEPAETLPAPSETQTPASTPLPQNPARVSSNVLVSTLLGGLGFVIGLFVLIGLYSAIRSNRRRRK